MSSKVIEELIARLKVEKRIYEDSPQVNVTYIDLARMIEEFLILIETKEIKGFENNVS